MRLGLGLQRGSRRLSSDPLAQIEGRVLDLRPDPSTMYVDAAGTQPAVVGDPVGRWEDQSGQGNHAVQETHRKKPRLRQREDGSYYLDFDGVDDVYKLLDDLLRPYTVAVRYKNEEIDPGAARVLQGSANWLIGTYGGSVRHFAGGWVDSETPVTEKKWRTAIATNDGSSRFYIDGEDDTANNSPNREPKSLFAGAEGSYADEAEDCLVSHIQVCSQAHPATIIRQIHEGMLP